jgi:hypothetical protein
MKNRNFVIIAIVLVSVICLGVIGYAGYTDDLSVKGNISINNKAASEDFDNDIHFDTTASTMKATVTAMDIDTEVVGTTTKTVAADTDGVTVTVGPQENGDENDLLSIKVDAGVLNFEGDKGSFTYENAQGEKCFSFGFGYNVFDKFPQYDYSDMVATIPEPGHRYEAAFSADWPEERKLRVRVQIIDKYFGNLGIIFGFRDENTASVRMTKKAEAFLREYEGIMNATAR